MACRNFLIGRLVIGAGKMSELAVRSRQKEERRSSNAAFHCQGRTIRQEQNRAQFLAEVLAKGRFFVAADGPISDGAIRAAKGQSMRIS
jgi:hypothetical protein